MKAIYLIFLTVLSSSICVAQTVDFNYSTADGNFCAPQLVQFTAQASGSPQSYLWVFGDGQVGYQANKTILYSTPGTYTVTLTVIYANEAISTTKTVTIHPKPSITLSSDIAAMCAPGNVTFTAQASTAVTNYQWNYGDGSTATTTGPVSTHQYVGFGTFTTTVTVVTSNGCSATASVVTRITPNPISGYVTPTRGCVPTNTTLVSLPFLAPGDAIQSATWNFGDGSAPVTTTTQFVTHSYTITTPITTASVTVTTIQGCISTFNFPTFAYGTPPTNTQVNTLTGATTFCASETVDFTGSATNASQYVWDFGDGSGPVTTTATDISHDYSDLGTFTVTVTPYFNGCAGSPATMQVEIVGVLALYHVRNTCLDKKTYTFFNVSIGNIDHFEWTFSDTPGLIDSVNFSPTHTFPTSGSFVAKLFLIDSITGCTDSLSFNIFTAEPVFTSNKVEVCKDSLIVYAVHQTYAANSGRTYSFHVNDSIINNSRDSILNYYPNEFGSFNDFVVIIDPTGASCADTLYLSNVTDVWGPVAAFNINPETCIDTALSFTNTSYPFNAAYPISGWQWNFGDSSFSDLHTPAPHLYNVDDTFNVVLIATDVNNCAQSATQQVIIRPLPIVVIFPITDSICLNETIELKVYSADSIFWLPHPDINCNTNCDTVIVSPTQPTMYIAGTQSAFGCRSFDTTTVMVYLPFNLEIYPADTAVCAGQPVQLLLNTTGTVNWSPPAFLNSTTIVDPVSTPDSSITYIAVLQDMNGCYSDTATMDIQVYANPSVDAGPDLILPYNSNFTLSPTYNATVATYLWTPPGNLSCTNCATPIGTALERIMYRIDITDTYGCTASDSMWVSVICEQGNLLIPNSFTPNADGLNDYFYPISRGYSSIKSFSVYNRMGERVFQRQQFAPNENTLGWDGSVKGNRFLTTQSFVWIIEAVCFSGEIVTAKGSVTLIR